VKCTRNSTGGLAIKHSTDTATDNSPCSLTNHSAQCAANGIPRNWDGESHAHSRDTATAFGRALYDDLEEILARDVTCTSDGQLNN